MLDDMKERSNLLPRGSSPGTVDLDCSEKVLAREVVEDFRHAQADAKGGMRSGRNRELSLRSRTIFRLERVGDDRKDLLDYFQGHVEFVCIGFRRHGAQFCAQSRTNKYFSSRYGLDTPLYRVVMIEEKRRGTAHVESQQLFYQKKRKVLTLLLINISRIIVNRRPP